MNPEVSRITVDCSTGPGKLHHFWQSTGFTPANLLLNADMRQAMAYAGAVPHGGITWVRIHYLLELVAAERLGGDDPVYDWTGLDTALDALVENRLKPIFELMGHPQSANAEPGTAPHFFSDYTDRAQATAWRHLVRELARHLIERYGRDEVRAWLFETWNEPDIRFWTQSVDAFLAYYDACAAGLHDADPELRLGGPGTCRNLSDTLIAFLAHCDTGTNTLTGEATTRPAFISVHEKGVRSHAEDLTPNSMGIVEREAQVIDYIREHHPALSGIPFSNNECDPQVGWGTIHTWRARPYYAALVVKIINQHLVNLVDGRDCDYALLSNDNGFLGTWGHRTLLTRFSETDHIDHGQADGQRDAPRLAEDPRYRRFELIKKPVLNVMTLLSLLGDERCAVAGVPEVSDPLGVIATRRGEEQVAVLVYRSHDKITRSGAGVIELEITGIPFDHATQVTYRIDESYADPFAIWESLGAPARPDPEQVARIREQQELTATDEPCEVDIPKGSLTLRFTQPLPGVTLILLTRRSGGVPDKVTGLRAERYEGLAGSGEILFVWQGLESRAIRTYEVQRATAVDGPYQRINAKDQLDTAFLHIRDGEGVARTRALDGEGAFYRVLAVDYWGGTGEPSDPIELE